MDRIKELMWVSLMVAVSLGMSGGFGARRKPAVEYRNPKLVEMVIDQPKEYPGFFYPVCDEDDPEFFRKVRRATGYSYLERVMTVVEIKVKGLRTPIQSWSLSRPLPVAYKATEVEFHMVGDSALSVKDLYVLQDDRFIIDPVSGLEITYAHELPVMQLPKEEEVNIADINNYAKAFIEACSVTEDL